MNVFGGYFSPYVYFSYLKLAEATFKLVITDLFLGMSTLKIMVSFKFEESMEFLFIILRDKSMTWPI